MLEAKVRKILS